MSEYSDVDKDWINYGGFCADGLVLSYQVFMYTRSVAEYGGMLMMASQFSKLEHMQYLAEWHKVCAS